MLGKGHLALVPLLFGTACHYQSVHPLQFPPSGNVSRHIFLTGPFPHRQRHAQWPVDVVECFIDFAVKHWYGCRATESGYAGDIGAIEIWLIDWLIDYSADWKQASVVKNVREGLVCYSYLCMLCFKWSLFPCSHVWLWKEHCWMCWINSPSVRYCGERRFDSSFLLLCASRKIESPEGYFCCETSVWIFWPPNWSTGLTKKILVYHNMSGLSSINISDPTVTHSLNSGDCPSEGSHKGGGGVDHNEYFFVPQYIAVGSSYFSWETVFYTQIIQT